ncbi:hypothetical protein SLS58_006043 [Diplodia intermedia]|uniref:Heterokaryon incompatibility domain-containing protein n=1 Tax=Diplodia intermedia TaxID=856260 RepID=A0ABR3TPI8_9PEZI
MDLPRYEYEPLSGPDDIRVLELGATKTRIEARILHVPVSARSFQALSYVWGNPNQESTAVILDTTGTAIGWIPLTKNLGHAMRDLRDAEELESKVFWIDQVCINQQDEKEKNHQVAMLSQIYTQASRVITYLGPATLQEEEEQRGIQLLKRISGTLSDTTWRQIHEAGSIERVLNWKLDGSMQLEQLPSDLDLRVNEPHDEEKVTKRYIEQGWKWLVHAAYGEWTQRLWIVQEQLLNNDITTLRGRRLIDWDSIATLVTSLGSIATQASKTQAKAYYNGIKSNILCTACGGKDIPG